MRSFRPVWNKSFGKITIFACGYLCRPHGKTKNWKKIKFQKEKQKTLNRVFARSPLGAGRSPPCGSVAGGGRHQIWRAATPPDPSGTRGRLIAQPPSPPEEEEPQPLVVARPPAGSASCALPSSPKAWFSKNGNGLINPQKNYSKSKTAANCGLLLRPDLVFKKNP